MIISSSFYFAIMEDSIPSFGDSLWYSFAIITTIGFGDYAAVSLTSRILSVILAINGIIVLASITSVIVNSYNETKGSDEKKDDKVDETKFNDNNTDTNKE